MFHRLVRAALLVVGLLVTTGLGYLAWTDEGALASAGERSVARERAAEDVLVAASTLRTALQASVWTGQDAGASTAQVGAQTESLQRALVGLQDMVASADRSVAASPSPTDALASAIKRVQGHLADGQPLLAADIVFTDVSNALDAIGRQAAAARDTARREAVLQTSALRRHQAGIVSGALLVWMVVAALLVPLPSRPGATVRDAAPPPGSDLDLALLRDASVTTANVTPPVEARQPAAPTSTVPLSAVAEVCTDLSSLSDEPALGVALARACGLLDATGAIVWMAAVDRRTLVPGLVHGYDSRVVERIGPIAADADNLTASVFRDGSPRAIAATAGAPAAVAVPMMGPAGPVGVLSAELRAGHLPESDLLALGAIFAAQLATLALPQQADVAAEAGVPRQALV